MSFKTDHSFQWAHRLKGLLCDAVITDLYCVLEAVVKLHLDTPVFSDRVQDHPQEELPHALENSTRKQTMRHPHMRVYQLFQLHPMYSHYVFTDNSPIMNTCK